MWPKPIKVQSTILLRLTHHMMRLRQAEISRFPGLHFLYAKKTNHSTDKCFKTKTCEVCNNNEHIGKYCKLKKTCQKCRKSGHVSANCFIRCRPCNSPAHGSVHCDLYPGLEPSQVECPRCANKLFI